MELKQNKSRLKSNFYCYLIWFISMSLIKRHNFNDLVGYKSLNVMRESY